MIIIKNIILFMGVSIFGYNSIARISILMWTVQKYFLYYVQIKKYRSHPIYYVEKVLLTCKL